jgi:hypothetical protein
MVSYELSDQDRGLSTASIDAALPPTHCAGALAKTWQLPTLWCWQHVHARVEEEVGYQILKVFDVICE